MELQGEFKKLRPPMYDGESEEDVEASSLNIKQYFQVYIYYDNLREHLSIFQMRRKVSLRWQDAKSVNNIRSKELSWNFFLIFFKYIYIYIYIYILE